MTLKQIIFVVIVGIWLMFGICSMTPKNARKVGIDYFGLIFLGFAPFLAFLGCFLLET